MKGPFSSCANGSKILVTTRNIKIAHSLGNKDPYHLHGLHHEQCMKIFRDKAFVDNEEEQEKLFLGEKIVAACGGVPLVVKVVGFMLQVADVEKWRVVSENTANWADNSDEIHPAIGFSYYDMPASLKRCFEYLAVFPPDYEFKQDDVVCLWIAEGLVEEAEGRRVEDIGNEYYNELKARSLIQENDMMHDIVHHLASRVSRKFCYKENSKVPSASVRHAFMKYPQELEYEFLAQAPCLRTLIVEGGFEDDLQCRILSLKMLRTLTRDSFEYIVSFEGRFLRHLKHMRYLSIGHTICALIQVQHLYLNCCENLKQLPKDIGNMVSLKTLDLTKTSISTLPDSICALYQLETLNLENCRHLKELPKDIGDLRSLRELNLGGTYYLRVPESILNPPRLENLIVKQSFPLTLHIESIARLEELAIHPIGSLIEQVAISMEEIGGIEEAKIPNLKFKKFSKLEFWWRELGNDEEMEVKLIEALEPHHALESLTFSNYPGDKFPAWIMSSNICLSNLVELKMEGLNKICEMIDMEFVSLKNLSIKNCPILRKVLMATPKLYDLTVTKCGELEANSLHLLPSLSDKAGLHSTVLRLRKLCCDYNILEYFFEKLKTANSKWDNLMILTLSGGGRVASLPKRWPSLLKSLKIIYIEDIEPGKFQFVPDGDQSTFPPSLVHLFINNCKIEKRLPHHWYTITAGREVKAEEETIDKEEVEQTDGESSAK